MSDCVHQNRSVNNILERPHNFLHIDFRAQSTSLAQRVEEDRTYTHQYQESAMESNIFEQKFVAVDKLRVELLEHLNSMDTQHEEEELSRFGFHKV